ncbi:hypothetical protein pdul_cds_286 [Pandoravirus dulcis]|uniref:Uncharacterized protein n=1 Tax=Pandoravirus dulcis TaxID=1349409 RepID=S4VPN4_9VIRU|nr:hypothetical protein pdul_cds_286 [Pandoravirus dulcis]AGO82268.1 hypothetical protein pdul_cds_286 [Pandoravirus dulcis]
METAIDLLTCAAAVVLWAAPCLAARCGLLVGYGDVPFRALLWTAQARAAAAAVALTYALAVVLAPDAHAWWWFVAAASGVGAGCTHYWGHDSLVRAAAPYLALVSCAAVLPAWCGVDHAWRAACVAWVVASTASLACDARTYGRLSGTDAAHIVVDGHAAVAAGLAAAHVHPLLPVAAALAWSLRAADALVGSRRRPGSTPPALFGMVALQRKALAVDVLYTALFVVLAAASGVDGWVAPWASVLASAALALEEHGSTLSARCEPRVAAFVRLVVGAPARPRGRMARRVRAPANNY